MKAITLWQPWASLMMIRAKQIETRGWSTDYCGPLAIHAGSKIPPTDLEPEFYEACAKAFGLTLDAVGPYINQLPRGYVLGTVELIGVYPVEILPDEVNAISLREFEFGNYESGRYAWHCRLIERLQEPIKARGMWRIWDWIE